MFRPGRLPTRGLATCRGLAYDSHRVIR
nr:hypothetical protein [Acinetobacter sp.]